MQNLDPQTVKGIMRVVGVACGSAAAAIPAPWNAVVAAVGSALVFWAQRAPGDTPKAAADAAKTDVTTVLNAARAAIGADAVLTIKSVQPPAKL